MAESNTLIIKQTKEQMIAVDIVQDGNNLKLNAFAGTGKTYTLTLIAEALQPKVGLYLAFNKGIAVEAKNKMPSNVKARTFHSIAYQAMPNWMKKRFHAKPLPINDFCELFKLKPISYDSIISTYYRGVGNGHASKKSKVQKRRISTYKLKRLIDLSLDNFTTSNDTYPSCQHVENTISKDISKLKIESPSTYRELITYITPIIEYLWKDYTSELGELPIGNTNHNIYFKHWVMSNPIIDYDFILFDEAQDADPLMLNVLERQKTQIIYVGDSHQQIYDFRGAVNALDKIIARKLYLTKSFRFGQKLADECKPIFEILGEKQRFKGSGDSTIIDYNPISKISSYSNYDAVIARTNAYVVRALVMLHSQKIPCNTNINTRYILDTIMDMKELNTKTYGISLNSLNTNSPIYSTRNNKLRFRCWDEFVLYMEEFNSDPELRVTYDTYMEYSFGTIINALKDAKREGGIVVTTAHKAKGLEWDRVAIEEDFIRGFFELNRGSIVYKSMKDCGRTYDLDRYKRQGGRLDDIVPVLRNNTDSLKSELRLLYVAITRCKTNINLGSITPIYREFFEMYQYLPSC